MPSETNKVKPRGQGRRPPEALGVGEPGARPGPPAGAGKAPALIWITDPYDGVLRQATYDPQDDR